VSKRPAAITQTEIKRAIRAAKQSGVPVEIEVRTKNQATVIYRFVPTASDPLAETQEITL
jgi:hypothetical protein